MGYERPKAKMDFPSKVYIARKDHRNCAKNQKGIIHFLKAH